MQFCVSNSNHIRKESFNNYLYLSDDYYIYFSDQVWYRETPNSILFFYGILWENDLELFFDSHIDTINGQFYAILFDKKTHCLTVFSDHEENYPIFYYERDQQLIITNNLAVFPHQYHQIDNDWVTLALDHLIMKNRVLKTPENISLYKENFFEGNNTLLKDVKQLGLGTVKTFSFKTNQCISSFRYYKPEIDYVELFFKKERYFYKDALNIVETILSSNLRKIKSTYKELTVLASTGIDSLVNLTYLDGKENVDVISYSTDFYPGVNDSHEFHKLHDTLNLPCHHIDFTKEEFITTFTESITNWAFPSYHHYLSPEIWMLNNCDVKDVIVKGYCGDQFLWHDPSSSIIWGIHQAGIQEFSQLENYLKDKYVHQPMWMSPRVFNLSKNHSYEESLISNTYYENSIIGGMGLATNKLILSPYLDIRLKNLLPQCNLATQEAAILNVQFQKDIISKELLPCLSSYCKGNVDELDYDVYPFIGKENIFSMFKELNKKNINLPSRYQNAIIQILNKDVVTLPDIKQLLLGAYIYNWIK